MDSALWRALWKPYCTAKRRKPEWLRLVPDRSSFWLW